MFNDETFHSTNAESKLIALFMKILVFWADKSTLIKVADMTVN